MTPEQQEIERIKDRLKAIATCGIRQTLLNISDELELLNYLLDAGMEASFAEIRSNCHTLDIYASGPAGEKNREKKLISDDLIEQFKNREKNQINDNLMEQLSSLHSTVSVVICALAAVRNSADSCNDAFINCHQSDIEPVLIKALIAHPQCLDNAAAETAMSQGDTYATATLRRQLSNLLKEEEKS